MPPKWALHTIHMSIVNHQFIEQPVKWCKIWNLLNTFQMESGMDYGNMVDWPNSHYANSLTKWLNWTNDNMHGLVWVRLLYNYLPSVTLYSYFKIILLAFKDFQRIHWLSSSSSKQFLAFCLSFSSALIHVPSTSKHLCLSTIRGEYSPRFLELLYFKKLSPFSWRNRKTLKLDAPIIRRKSSVR